MKTVSAGPELERLVALAVRADMPVLVRGPHGQGKSEGLAAAAANLGLGCIVRDLSLLEPPDLVGLPRERGERTIYAPPSWLPGEGKGLLVLEELNRAPSYMRAPALQLLSARTLNDYRLPPGWLPVAAMNNADGEYHVDDLDPALLSRFMQVSLVTKEADWLAWARMNGLHEGVVDFVGSGGVFAAPGCNPRAWTYAARCASAWDYDRRESEVLLTALDGLLPSEQAAALGAALLKVPKAIEPHRFIENYKQNHKAVREAVARGALSELKRKVDTIIAWLRGMGPDDPVRKDPTMTANLRAFRDDLPEDTRGPLAARLEEMQLGGEG